MRLWLNGSYLMVMTRLVVQLLLLLLHCLQAAASSAVEALIDMQGCLVVIISNSRYEVVCWCN
jgi:hypothetical protein